MLREITVSYCKLMKLVCFIQFVVADSGILSFSFPGYSCALYQDSIASGHLYLTVSWICFYSNFMGRQRQVRNEWDATKSLYEHNCCLIRGIFANRILLPVTLCTCTLTFHQQSCIAPCLMPFIYYLHVEDKRTGLSIN